MEQITFRSCNGIQRERIKACILMLDAVAYYVSVATLKEVVLLVFGVDIGRDTVTKILRGEL